jgi:hypothetical protein
MKTQEAPNGIIGSEWTALVGTSDPPRAAGADRKPQR